MHLFNLGAALAFSVAWRTTYAVPLAGNATLASERRDVSILPSMAERFTYQTGSQGGSCGWVTTPVLNYMLRDALKLAEAGQKLMEAAWDRNEQADDLVYTFFYNEEKDDVDRGEPDSGDFDEIADVYSNIAEWIRSGGPTRLGRAHEKPALLCGGKGLEAASIDDKWKDEEGDFEDDPSTGQHRLIKDDSATMDLIYDAQEEFDNLHEIYPNKPKLTAIPYYVPFLGTYVADESYHGNEYTVCSKELGATFSLIDNRDVIVLCPKIMGATNSNPNINDYKRLGSVAARPVKYDDVECSENRQALNEIDEAAVTLFHELVHLLFAEDTSPPRGEFVSIKRILNAGIKRSLRNPETYALAALAWYYTTEKSPPGGPPLEFLTGYTTQG